MYSFVKILRKTPLALVAALALCTSAITNIAQAATLEERAVYTVKILVWDDPATVGQCSAFTFGDVSALCASGAPSTLRDNTVAGVPALSGGDGIAGDNLAGTLTIETSKADGLGDLTFSLDAFQMDPYLQTAGGTFKTTMTPPDGSLDGSGTVDAAGNMTLDVTGRTGVAQFFESPTTSIGIQPWNIDDSVNVDSNGDPITNLYVPFTTGSSSNFDPSAGGINLTLTGRAIGDANADTILDAVLVSVGNVGAAWQAFDGTPYSEAFNVQFELISAKPVANSDLLVGPPDTPLVIDIATDLLANDTHATGDSITLDSFTQPVEAGSSIVDNGDGTLTYTPDPALLGADADSFTYTIIDTAAETDTTTVTINLATGNPPVANDINFQTDEDTPLDLDPTTNDTDPDTDALTIFDFDTTTAEVGTVVAQGGNILNYNPAANFSGPDSFGYTITDGNGNIASATVFVTVNPVNDPPVCTDVNLNTATDTPLEISVQNDLLSTCTDVEVDTISFVSVSQPTQSGSTVSDDGAGTLTYTPAPGFNGQDSFTYTATDGTDTDTRTVFVDVGKIFGNFTMLNQDGDTFGGTNDVVFTWDGTCYNSEAEADAGPVNMTMKTDTPTKFFGFVWDAHDIKVFCPRLQPYVFDTCNDASVPANKCGDLSMTVPPFHLGGHILFDWNNTTDIDVAIVWNNSTGGTWQNNVPGGKLYQGQGGPTPALDEYYDWISVDADGDGVPGIRFVDGPYINYRANFSFKTSQGGGGTIDIEKSSISSPNLGSTKGCTISNTPVSLLERSDWLILAGLVVWLGFGRLRRRRTH